jgi:hypothetical protein
MRQWVAGGSVSSPVKFKKRAPGGSLMDCLYGWFVIKQRDIGYTGQMFLLLLKLQVFVFKYFRVVKFYSRCRNRNKVPGFC